MLGAVFGAVSAPCFNELYQTSQVEIKGKWDNSKARQLISDKLEQLNWHEFCGDPINCDPQHTIIKPTYNFTDSESDWKVIAASTKQKGCDDKFCQTYIHLFEYKHTNYGWDLWRENISFATLEGFNNELDEFSSGFGLIANDKRAFFLHSTDSRRGNTINLVSVYAPVGNTYEPFLVIPVFCEFTNGGDKILSSLDTNYQLLPMQSGFFNLNIEIDGFINNEPYSFRKTYEFNGHSYFDETEIDRAVIPTCSNPNEREPTPENAYS